MDADLLVRRAPAWGDTDIQPQALRRVLGQYPTGVAVVSTRTADGRAVGLTINSFASLSLAPALVLWSLVDRSPHLAAFRQAWHQSVGDHCLLMGRVLRMNRRDGRPLVFHRGQFTTLAALQEPTP